MLYKFIRYNVITALYLRLKLIFSYCQNQLVKIFAGILFVVLLTGCQQLIFNKNSDIPPMLQEIQLVTDNQNNFFSRLFVVKLSQYGIKVNNNNDQLVKLTIKSVTSSDEVVSLLDTGVAAEKQISLQVLANLVIPDQGEYPIASNISRSFFDNSSAALANEAAKQQLEEDMYDMATEKIIVKAIAIIKNKNK